jgi:hypothetical protein
MDLARWRTLVTQMTDSGLIKNPVEPAACFRDPVVLLAGKSSDLTTRSRL